jgi:hypothetical protein
MENMGTSWGRGHEQHDLVEVVPPLVSEGLGFGVLLNVVIPGRCRISHDRGISVIVPHPARNRLDRTNNAIQFAELQGY